MGVKALQLPISYTSMKLLWRGLGKTGPPQKRYHRGTRGVVRMKGLEPSRIATPEPKSGASTNFATSACRRAL